MNVARPRVRLDQLNLGPHESCEVDPRSLAEGPTMFSNPIVLAVLAFAKVALGDVEAFALNHVSAKLGASLVLHGILAGVATAAAYRLGLGWGAVAWTFAVSLAVGYAGSLLSVVTAWVDSKLGIN